MGKTNCTSMSATHMCIFVRLESLSKNTSFIDDYYVELTTTFLLDSRRSIFIILLFQIYFAVENFSRSISSFAISCTNHGNKSNERRCYS